MGQRWLRVVAAIITVLVSEVGLSHGCQDQERTALLQLKSVFDFIKSAEGSNCCEWEQVECNITTKRVTKLSLGGCGLYTHLFNASLFLPFEELRSLDINATGIVGCVENEGFGKLSKLRHLEDLDLSYNDLDDITLLSLREISSLKSLGLRGIDIFKDLKRSSRLSISETLDLNGTNRLNNFLLHLGGLSSLESLDLGENNLEGTVYLHGLYNLTNLKMLDLSDNQIESLQFFHGNGRQPSLINLEEIDLSYNLFNNSILAELRWLSNLKSLNIGYNQLKGSIKEFCGWSNLESLDLSYNEVNQLVNSKCLYNLTNLKKLDLSYNQIESLQFFHGNGRQPSLINLEEIDLTSNLFNNSILAELRWLSNLKSLNIGNNQLKGSIKEFCGWSNLESLDLSYNEVNQLVNSKENSCFRKLKFLFLDCISTKENVSLTSLLELFPSVKTLTLRENSFLIKTGVTQDLHLSSKVEILIMDNTPLDINFLESIGILTSLKVLSLYNCSLAGSLPAKGWCDLKSLEELSFRGNALRGAITPCLGNLTSLRYLDFSNNQLTGNIASSPLTNLTMLQFLSLLKYQFLSTNDSKFVAEPAFQTWSPKFQLRVFILSDCKIDKQGKLQFPNFLYYQYDLRYVDLSDCNFGGIKFPHWLLENNTRLGSLYMIDSSIVGPLFLPSHPNPNLKLLDISKNKIQYDIPRNFCSLFPNLGELYMSENAFKSKIPLCFGSMRWLETLDLSHNNIFGGIPKELALSNSLGSLGLSNNAFRGKIFPTVCYLINSLEALFLDGNNFEGEFPDCSPIGTENLEELDVSDNRLSGKLPRWLWNMTHLTLLNLSKNHFEGSIPMELCNLVNLEFLDISENHLSGTIPSCSNLQKIKFVHLSRNKLSGPLSDAFYGSPSLVTLDLSENNFTGRIPDWIGTLPVLSILLLKANHFHGEIPIYLCRLYSLSILNLSQNKLSGPIPSCLSNLPLKSWSEKSVIYDSAYFPVLFALALEGMGVKSFGLMYYRGLFVYHSYPFRNAEEEIEVSTKNAAYTYKGIILDLLSVIDLSCNQLTGMIPFELGNLSEIRGLNLSHNNLTGSIPSTFSKLKQIESLDLSYNNLNGKIPPQLTELTFLGVFTVAYNNLSGPLPDMKAQFGTFTESSYEGNPLLCGLPLKNSCNEDDSPEIPNASSGEEEHGFIDMGDFYISFAVSYAIIFLATVIVLYINPYWRQACFYFVEERSTACYFFIVDTLHRLPCFRRNM